jgi:hypothetical protein
MANRNLEKKSERIEALHRLMDRLCAPDLMLPEAAVLRSRLWVLLLEQEDEGPSPAPAPEVRLRTLPTLPLRGEKGRSGLRSPLASPCLGLCLTC